MNHSSKPFKAVLVFVLSLFVMAVAADHAFARRRSRRNNAAAIKAKKESMIKAAQSQYTAAQQVLSAAQAGGSIATGRLQAVLAEMTNAANSLRQARVETISLSKDLAEIEDDILAEQSSDSQYVQLLEEMRKIKGDMSAAESRITSDPKLAAELDKVASEKGKAAAFALRQTAIQSDPECTGLRAVLLGLVDKQSRLKRELFEKDTEWKNTHELLHESQRAEQAAKAEVYAHAPERAGPKREIKDAKEAAASAQSAMAQAEEILRRLGKSPNSGSGSASSSSKAKK